MENTMRDMAALVLWAIEAVCPDDSPDTAARKEKAIARLQLLAPLADFTDDFRKKPRGEPNAESLACFLEQSLRVDRGSLTLVFLESAAGDCLPERPGRYNKFFFHLIAEESECLRMRAEERLGQIAVELFERRFWEMIGNELVGFLTGEYGQFLKRVGHGVATNAIEGFVYTVSNAILAIAIDDSATLAVLAAPVRQLPFCLPIGSLPEDPSRWYIALPDIPDLGSG